MVLRQDKGRGIVVIDRTKYTEKCLDLLNTDSFIKLDHDPTKTIEGKIQRSIRKIKNNLTKQEYNRLYPTGSSPGKLYGTAKRHKLKKDSTVDDLPLRPIISNVGTASYQLAKYLAKLLSPLSKSQYTVNSTKDFIEFIRKEKVPSSYKMISFDVTSLFTMVPLDYTIDLALKRIYDNKEIKTTISRTDMKNLLLLCTKNVHFTYNNDIYQQKDGVAMGSPLGPVLAGIFMVHLERTLMPKLEKFMKPWKRYVDDTITYIKPESILVVINILNSFHQNIKFTYELEKDGKISFLDVLLIRANEVIETTVFRKETNNDVYLHWKSFAPITWKRGTLKTLIRRAYTICSNDKLLKKELDHLEKCFTKVNGYPKWLLKQTFESFSKEENNNTTNTDNDINENNSNDKIIHTLKLPYQGDEGVSLIKSIKNATKKTLPENHDVRVILTGKKLSSLFNIKDDTKKMHKHDLVYYGECPTPNCIDNYIGETGRRINERVIDHSGRDKKSHMLKHHFNMNHDNVDLDSFKILNMGYNNNIYKRRVSEALYVKQYRPTLNVQENSVPLHLFN